MKESNFAITGSAKAPLKKKRKPAKKTWDEIVKSTKKKPSK